MTLNPRYPDRLLHAFFLLLLVGFGAHETHSFDIFWQLQSGKYIWQTGEMIRTDLFSLAADVPRWEHCWLHDVIFYVAWRLGDFAGINLLKGVVIGVAAWLPLLIARRRGASWIIVAGLSVPLLLLTRSGWMERPQIWTFLLLTVFMLVFDLSREAGKEKRLAWLVLLMVLWSNLHAGAVLAFPLVVAYLCGEAGDGYLLKREAAVRRVKPALWLLAGVVVASMLTPYGAQMLKALLWVPGLGEASGNIGQVYNMDWRGNPFNANPFYYYVLAGSLLLLLSKGRKVQLTDLLLVGGVGLMGTKLVRHAPLFYFVAAAIVPGYLDALARRSARYLPRPVTLGTTLLAALLALSLLGWSLREPYRVLGLYDLGVRTFHYPIAAAEFVKEQRLPKNIYNTYDWGGYLMWTLYPEYQVFWDGRSDSLEMFQQGLTVMGGQPGWEKILAAHEVKTIVSKGCLVDNGRMYPLLDKLRSHPDWALVFADVSALIFVRRDAVEPRWLERYQLPASRIDDTVLSEATLLTTVDPNRVMGFWEMFRIYNARQDYPQAYAALKNFMARTTGHQPALVNYFKQLEMKFGGGDAVSSER